MPAPFSETSFQPLARLLDYARYFFGGLLIVTAALLTWQHYGMEKVVDLTGDHFPVFIEDDRNSGGASVGRIERRGQDLVVHCLISRKSEWPYCKLGLSFLKGATGLDMSRFDYMSIDGGYAGPGTPRFAIVLAQAEEGLTRLDQWQTYKINQIDALDLPPDGGTLVVPLKWFGVAQWWKDMAQPALEHSAVNIDNVARAEVLISGGGKEGAHAFTLHHLRLHGKLITLDALLMGLVATWVVCAVGWLAVLTLSLRSQLRNSRAAVALLKTVNEALELEARDLAGQAHIDPLTGVLNRQGLRAALMSTSSLLADPMVMIFIDIDHFKSINDTHGHDVGDDVLRKFANVIASGIRSSDRLVRWGGEEFLIVCPMTNVYQGRILAENLRTALHRQTWPAGLHVTASFGVAQHRERDEVGVVIKRADMELYRAKQAGRDRVCAYIAADMTAQAAAA
ncbi:GGDEF domain-containing protein [Massilia sp.]|uniref:GGDEF domain-containing protein n=1 Tax=Massilia sp. TaxID=1882437 RepID=UPI003919F9C7